MLAPFPRYQRSLIYQPVRAKVSPSDAMLSPGRVHDVFVRTEDGLTLRGWHVLARGRSAADRHACDRELAAGRSVVLYFPGNGGHRLYRRDEFELLASLGVDVLAFDYRGYAENPGLPSEEAIARDAHCVWKYVTEERGISPGRVVLYGESLGGAIALRLAAECCERKAGPRALVVRSTFPTLGDVAAHWFPWLPARWFVLEKYRSIERIAKVDCPLLQLHGVRDNLIPLKLAEKLFAAAPERSRSGLSRQFVPLRNANHNDVVFADRARLHESLNAFLGQVASTHELSVPRPHFLSPVPARRHAG